MFYLSRFLHIFGLDSDEYLSIRAWAANYCSLLQRETIYLELRPSQVAAASLMFAVNMVDQSARIQGETTFAPVIARRLELGGLKNGALPIEDYTGLWTPEIEKLTSVSYQYEIAPLLEVLRTLA